MTLLVDMSNKDIIHHIRRMIALPKTDPLSPYNTIPSGQMDLYNWAVAYEEGLPEVPDDIYDMWTRALQRQEIMFPDIWEKVSIDCFRDGSWKFSGMFIHAHNDEDEEWL